ncbi:hypothetical protein [Spiroplasma turonicum]|uniref:Uncharacterized protein n=1 Tax=Spiroplasma turonicum TaxID=216946 RepID=A0A0K1P7Q5_9MOLU|nr:hypothetical protein [Spiroplasma turonicum]AKU79917.1 hypothetical protein STURON_00671 [Spiroplasma turonicum]ALX70930.1 hypothetical protein STURO_v1c06710 [Spiroplasma turonicum]
MTNCEKQIEALNKEWQDKLNKELKKSDAKFKELKENNEREMQKRDQEMQKLVNVLKKNNIDFDM